MQIKQRRPKAVKMDWRRQATKSFIAMMERILEMVIAGIALAMLFPAAASIVSTPVLAIGVCVAYFFCFFLAFLRDLL